MPENDNNSSDQYISVSLALRIDEVCDRFEAAWQRFEAARQSEQPPSIKDFVSGEGQERQALLRKLLRVELDYRRLHGERAAVEDYLPHFPNDEALLRAVMDRQASTSNETVAESTPYAVETCAKTIVLGYEIRGWLGKGGMAEALLVHDPKLDRPLALKVMLPELLHQPDAESRFLAEARITAQLQHPSIPPVHEVGRLPDGRPFMAMKLIDGRRLDKLLKERSASSDELPRFVAIFGQICQAVGYAHSQGVIHRDLKPHNVMIGPFGEVQVMDWGLAKVLSSGGLESHEESEPGDSPHTVAVERTLPGTILGTAAFMAPEQARGEVDRLDERADVFGLGAILCVVLTGQPAFVGVDGNAVLRASALGDLSDTFARLDACGADVELVTLARCCLAPDLEQRPRNAAAVAAAVVAYQAEVEERARRAELGQVAAQARAEEATVTANAERRARRMTLGLAAAVLLLLTGGGIGAWLVREQREAEKVRQLAEQARQQETDVKARLTMDRAREILDEGWRKHNPAKLQEAKADAGKAVEIARSGNASAEVSQEAETLQQDVEKKIRAAEKNRTLLAAWLDVTAPRRETRQYVRGESGTMMALAEPTPDEQFAGAFRRWGMDLDHTPLEEVVARLQSQLEPVLPEVVAGLESWMMERRRQKDPQARWRQLLQLADRLDPSDQGREVRGLLVSDQLQRERIAGDLSRVLLPWSALSGAVVGEHRRRLLELVSKVEPAREPVLGVVSLARALIEAGDDHGAEGLLRSSLVARPDEAVLLEALGSLLAALGRPAKAVEYFRAVRALRPQLGVRLGQTLVYAGEAAEGIAILRELTQKQPNNPEMHAGLGYILSDLKDSEKAVAACRKAIKLKPNYPEVYYNLGNALLDQKKLEGAIDAFREAIKLKPGYFEAHCNLGFALREQKKLDEAVAAYRVAIKLKPDHAEVYFNLGNTLNDQKKLEGAIDAFHTAIALRPDHAEAYCNLGDALRNLGNALRDQKKLSEAVDACRMAIKLKPDFAAAYNNLGGALGALKKLDEAVDAYRTAIKLKRNYAKGYGNLGGALGALKKLDEAVEACRTAIALEPDVAEWYSNLGNALYAQKKLDDAVDAYRKALKYKREYGEVYYNLGNALLAQKKLDEAVDAFRKADHLLPNHPLIRHNLRVAERWLALEKRLLAILAKKDQPRNSQEQAELGTFCLDYRHHYASALSFFSDAFTSDPKLADDLLAQYRYQAALAAVLATSKGEDAKNYTGEERHKLRQRALQWLRADLDAYTKLAQQDNETLRQAVWGRLSYWLQDSNLATVREAKELAALPEQERKPWEKLWTDVDTLLRKVRNDK